MMFWIILTVYTVISMIAAYRFEIAWNYMMHIAYPLAAPKVERLRDGQWVLISFNIIPIVSLTCWVCNFLAPYLFNFAYKDLFWGFFHAKLETNYNGEK